MAIQPPRVGISRCLLGDRVRYDGGHKRDPFLTEVLGRFVEWVPVCPEVEAGLGIPREPMRLQDAPDGPRLLTVTRRRDQTPLMLRYSERKLHELEALDLSGFIFKKDSPSCGLLRVPLYTQDGKSTRNGTGLFARAFVERFPLIPVEEEGRLNNPHLREQFIERVFCDSRWRDLIRSRVTRHAMDLFHPSAKRERA